MTRPALKIVPPEPSLLDLFRERDAMIAAVKVLDSEIAAGVKAWSYERGFCVPCRPEAVRRELEAGE